MAAAAWSWVEKMLHEAQRTCGAEGGEGLDQDGGLDRHVQRAGDAGALERLRCAELGAQRHQAGHLGLGDLDLLAAEIGEGDILDDVIFAHEQLLWALAGPDPAPLSRSLALDNRRAVWLGSRGSHRRSCHGRRPRGIDAAALRPGRGLRLPTATICASPCFAAAQIARASRRAATSTSASAPCRRIAAPAGLAQLGLRHCRVDTGGIFAALGLDRRRTEASYLRLALPAAFAGEYRRILYLDCGRLRAGRGFRGADGRRHRRRIRWRRCATTCSGGRRAAAVPSYRRLGLSGDAGTSTAGCC